MAPGNIGASRMETPGGGDSALDPVAGGVLPSLAEEVVDAVAHELGDRRSPLDGQRPQLGQLLFRQLYLGSNHVVMMALTQHYDNALMGK